MQPQTDTMAHEVLGPFRLVRRLGEGGTSVVYLAERVDFAQRVAIKLFHEQIAVEGIFSGVEESALASLDHPHIVRLIDYADANDGRRYLVMEFVDGLRIDEYCDGHSLNLSARIRLLLQVLDAVEYAHRRLVVHADVKPANILVSDEGSAKLLDFGAAAGAHTPDFASPEQRTGERITLATDIYSLGLLARVLLAGVAPSAHPAELTSTLFSRLPQADDIAQARGTTSTKLMSSLRGDLDAILKKALHQNPDNRFLSAEQFSDDLHNYLANRPVEARRTNRIERGRKWIVRHKLLASLSGILAAVILFSVVGVLWQSAKAARGRSVAQARLHDLVRLTGTLDGELYNSLNAAPQSGPARAALLANVSQSLNRLAETDSRDPVLAIELAGQYEKLARLQLAQTPPASREAGNSVARGIALLDGLPVSENLQVQLNSLQRLQQSMRR